jgi:hypothetical protein
VAFDNRIQNGFATQFAAGEATGFAEALDDVGANLENQAKRWQAEVDVSADDSLKLVRSAQIEAVRVIREYLRGETQKRKQLAERLRQSAEMALGGAARQICGL